MHVAREWVVEQLRFPQRALRTTAVIAWSHVSATTQSAVAGLSNVILDPNELVAQPSWWRRITGRPRGYPQLTTGQRAELQQAHTSLHWPLREEGPEIRLVAVAEDVVARVVSHPAWKHPLLDGHRTVLGFTIELHLVAAAAHDLFSLRANTPAVPDNDITDNLARARAEWERRQVVAAKAEAGLIDRVAALRAYEAALTPIATSVHDAGNRCHCTPFRSNELVAQPRVGGVPRRRTPRNLTTRAACRAFRGRTPSLHAEGQEICML